MITTAKELMEVLEKALPGRKFQVSQNFSNDGILEREYYYFCFSDGNKWPFITTRKDPTPEGLLNRILASIPTPQQELEAKRKELEAARAKQLECAKDIERLTGEIEAAAQPNPSRGGPE
jgi:hypothetical protein